MRIRNGFDEFVCLHSNLTVSLALGTSSSSDL